MGRAAQEDGLSGHHHVLTKPAHPELDSEGDRVAASGCFRVSVEPRFPSLSPSLVSVRSLNVPSFHLCILNRKKSLFGGTAHLTN
jgi:hypothetical protein